MHHSENDEFDWSLSSGATSSEHTGPMRAESGEFYIHIEASEPRERGNDAM